MHNKVIRSLELAHLVAWINSSFLQIYLIPFLFSGVVVISGFIQDMPAWSLVLLASIVFSFVVWGILGAVILSGLMSVSDKLDVHTYNFYFDSRAFDSATELTSVQFGIALRNRALFPINYRVISCSSVFDGRVKVVESSESSKGLHTVPADAIWTYRDRAIDLNPPISFSNSISNERRNGTLSFEIEYGRGSRLKNTLKSKINVICISDKGSISWIWTVATN